MMMVTGMRRRVVGSASVVLVGLTGFNDDGHDGGEVFVALYCDCRLKNLTVIVTVRGRVGFETGWRARGGDGGFLVPVFHVGNLRNGRELGWKGLICSLGGIDAVMLKSWVR